MILGNVAHWYCCVVYADSQLLKYSLRRRTITFVLLLLLSKLLQKTLDTRKWKAPRLLSHDEGRYLPSISICHFLGIFNLPATRVPLSRPVSLSIGSRSSLLKIFASFFFSFHIQLTVCMMSFFFRHTEWIY